MIPCAAAWHCLDSYGSEEIEREGKRQRQREIYRKRPRERERENDNVESTIYRPGRQRERGIYIERER
jgi:hypothetical protein